MSDTRFCCCQGFFRVFDDGEVEANTLELAGRAGMDTSNDELSDGELLACCCCSSDEDAAYLCDMLCGSSAGSVERVTSTVGSCFVASDMESFIP